MSTKCNAPSSSAIDDTLAAARIKIYTDYKKQVLDRIIGYKDDISEIEYDPNKFLDLLNKICLPASPTNPSAKLYSGVRIYFANYCFHPDDCDGNNCIPSDPSTPTKDCRDSLTLIFVPTVLNGGVNMDDISNCLIIKKTNQGDSVFNLPNPATVATGEKDTASRWVRNFQNGKGIALATDGRFHTGNSRFMETNCLWYSLQIITELAAYLQCLLSENLKTQVKALIAAFITIEDFPDIYPPYQLSLIFEFIQPNTDKEGSTSSFFGSKNSSKEKNANLGDGETDTGRPCPPPTCTSVGALLPAK